LFGTLAACSDHGFSRSSSQQGMAIPSYAISQLLSFNRLAPYIWGYVKYFSYLVYALLVYNIGHALFPLVQRKDEMLDIPLTPGQRALLGLDPNATPPLTPGQQYVTPPRYQRSRGGTPVSARRSLPGSPLAGRDLRRDASLGSPSPGSAGRFDSPKSSVQANNRWLYKKGMESSRALYLL